MFGHYSDILGTSVEWTWTTREAMTFKTHKPKIQELKILSKLDRDTKKKVRDEIYKQIMDREHPNKSNKPIVRSY
tara:strand:+ start:354 stop:578 length:225 start_codon:yes stop_codon:yes gene_type:complete